MTMIDGTDRELLRSYVARIERLEDEKRSLAEDIREVYTEAKDDGFDIKIVRQVVKLRRMSADERSEREMLLDTYMAALGMLADTPLGEAALRREGLAAAAE